MRQPPKLPTFKATIPEWRVVLDAMRRYQEHLSKTVATLASEDAEFLVYDDLERLKRLIPGFTRQLAESAKAVIDGSTPQGP